MFYHAPYNIKIFISIISQEAMKDPLTRYQFLSAGSMVEKFLNLNNFMLFDQYIHRLSHSTRQPKGNFWEKNNQGD
jgi:hypothetical protein